MTGKRSVEMTETHSVEMTGTLLVRNDRMRSRLMTMKKMQLLNGAASFLLFPFGMDYFLKYLL